jgi:NADH-quinone oxidoreductase subunit L
MFVACGVGYANVGVFHVMTHAFFKALMFLGAGSVIHALHEEQDIFKMGSLRKKMPITFVTFLVGWAAILGLPPFSGFYSKDEILIQAYQSPHGGPVLLLVMMASALLTAFYMTRLLVLVFFGPSRMEKKVESQAHESPLVMTLPLMILAVLSLGGGWFGPPVSGGPTLEHGSSATLIMVSSVVMALIAAGIAFKKYSNLKGYESINGVVRDGFQIDAFYLTVFGRGTERVSQWFGHALELGVVQRMIRWTTAIVDLSGNLIRVVQTGATQAYLAMMIVAIFMVIAWFLYGVGQYGKL